MSKREWCQLTQLPLTEALSLWAISNMLKGFKAVFEKCNSTNVDKGSQSRHRHRLSYSKIIKRYEINYCLDSLLIC